jgi:hypothetical protein
MSDKRLYEATKYVFSQDEIRALGEALAREAQAIVDLRDRKKTMVAAVSAQIQAANERAVNLATKINVGFELREVECLVLLETPRPGMKRIVRMDTNETIRDEPMTAREMQGSFGFGEEPEA